MHEHIGSFKHNPTQNFHKNFANFENPQKFSREPKNLGLMLEMHECACSDTTW